MLKIWIQKVRSSPWRDEWSLKSAVSYGLQEALNWAHAHHVKISSNLYANPQCSCENYHCPCVLSWSEEVTANRGGCYGDRHLPKKWGYVTKRTPDYEKFDFTQKRKYSPENIEVYLGLLSQNQKLKEKKLDLGADHDYCRYNIQFFGFNTNRSAKAYYFRLNYDQWATVGFRLFKTKAPSFLPAGLQKGKNLS